MARLTEHVRALFRVRPKPITIPMLAEQSGLPVEWLANFGKGRLKTVDADRVQTLYETLTQDRSRLNFD